MTKQTCFSSDIYLYNNVGYQQYQFDDTWPRPDHSENVVYEKKKQKTTKLHFSVNQLLFINRFAIYTYKCILENDTKMFLHLIYILITN